MKRMYSDCYYCGGAVEERLLPREIWWKGELFLIEDVPMGVCLQCGEKVIHSSVAKTIDEILQSQSAPRKTIQVPVFSFA